MLADLLLAGDLAAHLLAVDLDGLLGRDLAIVPLCRDRDDDVEHREHAGVQAVRDEDLVLLDVLVLAERDVLAGQVGDVVDAVPVPAQADAELDEGVEQAFPPQPAVDVGEPLASVDLGDVRTQQSDGCTERVDDHRFGPGLVALGKVDQHLVLGLQRSPIHHDGIAPLVDGSSVRSRRWEHDGFAVGTDCRSLVQVEDVRAWMRLK